MVGGVFLISLRSVMDNSKDVFLEKKIIRMPIAINRPFSDYDTANIQSARQANIIRNLFSPLIENDANANLIPGVAARFEWINNDSELVFYIRDNLKTITGYQITAEDAYLSLKRLIIKNTNTHGSLKSFLCPDNIVTKVSDECPGLSYKDNMLILRPKSKEVCKFILPLLTSLDFSVIPKISIDWTNLNYNIIDYTNTSGPFYLYHEDPNGNSILKVNKNHYHYKTTIPQEVHLVVKGYSNSIDLLKENKIDLIPTYDGSSLGERLALESNSKFNVHRTIEIDLKALSFTAVGKKKFTPFERYCIGLKVKKSFLNHFQTKEAATPTNEYFPLFGEGSLDEDKRLELAEYIKKFESCEFKKNITISEVPTSIDVYRDDFRNDSNINFIEFTKLPWLKEESEQEDAYMLFADTGFYESISLLSHYLPKITNMTAEESTKWIENYISIENKEDRFKLLRKLHFEILKQGYIIPFSASPIVAVARAPWKPNFYKFYAGTPLWMLEAN